jgi:hypothetical protein
VNPTRRNFNRHVEARAKSDGGILGGDLTIVGGSVRWTGNLSDQVDLAARGACGKKDIIFWGRVESQNWLRLHKSTYLGLRHHFWWLFWPRRVTMVAQLAQAATAGGAQRADDGISSIDP